MNQSKRLLTISLPRFYRMEKRGERNMTLELESELLKVAHCVDGSELPQAVRRLLTPH
jgi:hypothetical protein